MRDNEREKERPREAYSKKHAEQTAAAQAAGKLKRTPDTLRW